MTRLECFCRLTHQDEHCAQNPRIVRFGSFEADLYTRELRKHGLKLKVQEQPFQVLAMLLARPGELVTREEIRSRLWPQDTFIDFDHGLNAAVRRLTRRSERQRRDTEIRRDITASRVQIHRSGGEAKYRRGRAAGNRRYEPTRQLRSRSATANEVQVASEKIALDEAVDQGAKWIHARVTMVRSLAARSRARDFADLSRRKLCVRVLRFPSNWLLPRAGEARAPKRVKVLLAAVVMAVVTGCLCGISDRTARERSSQPSDHWLYSLYRIFLATRHSNTSQTESLRNSLDGLPGFAICA